MITILQHYLIKVIAESHIKIILQFSNNKL